MNQYTNHTASDNVSDIRAISALQEQVDYLDTRVEALEEAVGKLTVMLLQPTPFKK